MPDGDGRPVEIIVKLRAPGSGVQFGATSLACELICATIARLNGLPVPDYGIAEIPTWLPAAVPDAHVSGLLSNNTGANFATVYHEGYETWTPGVLSRSLDTLTTLENVLAFDSAVLNSDRRRAKPNLLVRGDHLLLIDHALCLSVFGIVGGVTTESALTDAQVRDHPAFSALRGQQRLFSALLTGWRDTISSGDLAALRAVIPSGWEQNAGELDAIFAFLGLRPPGFPHLSSELRRVVG